MGAVGELEAEGGVAAHLSLVVGPGETAGDDDGGLVDRAGALPGAGHMPQGAFDPSAGQRTRFDVSEVGGEPLVPQLLVATQCLGAAARRLEVGEVAADERVEGGGLSAVFDDERGEGGGGVVAAAVDAPVAAAGSVGGGDGELPDAGVDLSDAAGPSGLALGGWSGWGWGSGPAAPSEAEVFDPDTARVGLACGDGDLRGEGPAGELPGDPPCGSEAPVDADLGGAVAVAGAEPKMMGAVGVDVGLEALLNRPHHDKV